MSMLSSKRKGGVINRYLPKGVDLLTFYADYCQCFHDSGWYTFCEKLHGHNVQVTKANPANYDGQ